MKIAPSVLSADFVNMEQGIRLIEKASCEWIHLDMMDGKFVRPITFGGQMIKSIRGITELVLDAHLMIDRPENQIDILADAGTDYVTIHLENTVHTHRLLQQIRDRGMKAGIAMVPSTPVSALSELLPFIDLALVMLVNPGAGGQKLIPECVKKIARLYELREQLGLNFLISADGGINRNTIRIVRDAGLDIAVCGSSFFGAEDPVKEAEFLLGL